MWDTEELHMELKSCVCVVLSGILQRNKISLQNKSRTNVRFPTIHHHSPSTSVVSEELTKLVRLGVRPRLETSTDMQYTCWLMIETFMRTRSDASGAH